jgi:hypothetical protein
MLALVTGIAVIDGKAAWAQGIPRLEARVIAINIPGASAVSQVGTFISGPPTPFGQCTLPHPIPGFSSGDFIKTGAVLDPNRILVGSRSNFGAPLAIGVGQEGSFLSIDPSAPRILNVPLDFAKSGVQASALGGAVQMYSANSPQWSNGVNNFGAITASYTGVSDPLGLSNNNAFGRLWPANAPFGDTGIGSSSVLDPDGRPLKGAPSSVLGGVYVGDLTNRDKVQVPQHPQVIAGLLSKGAVGTALLGPSPDGTCRAVFAVVTADGAIVQEHTQKGLDGIAPKGTVKPLLGRSWDSPHQHVEPRLGVLMNPYTAKQSEEQLFVSEPFNNTIAVINLVVSGTAPDQVFGLRPPASGSVHRISSPSLKLPVDLAPVKRDAGSVTWASNTTLDEDSDFFVANRGDNTIVRMRQDGTVVGIRRVTIDSIPLDNFAINGIATSVDGSKIYVTFTTPTKLEGGLLEVPAFGGCSLHSMSRFMPQSRHADKRNRCHFRG